MQKRMEKQQRDFMPEDSKAGIIQSFPDEYPGEYVCSVLLYREALKNIEHKAQG